MAALPVLAATSAEERELETLLATTRLRIELATSVARNEQTSEQALARLIAATTPAELSGGATKGMPVVLTSGQEGGFARAALEIGHRLLGAERADAAEYFFVAAEEAFSRALAKTPARETSDRAAYLEKRALIRGLFLGQAEQAKADLEEAIRLRPNDRQLREMSSLLARGRPSALIEKERGP